MLLVGTNAGPQAALSEFTVKAYGWATLIDPEPSVCCAWAGDMPTAPATHAAVPTATPPPALNPVEPTSSVVKALAVPV